MARSILNRGLCVGFLCTLAAASTSAQTGNVGASFQSMAFISPGPVPPDTTGAAGPNHWMQYNNSGVQIFNKDGSTIAGQPRLTEAQFWNDRVGLGVPTTGAGSPLGDPRMFFDTLSGRWYALAFTAGTAGVNNSLLIGRTDTSDPTGDWDGAIITSSQGLFLDFPSLGFDRNGVYISTNNFTSGGVYQNANIYSIPKVDLLAGTPSLTNMASFLGQSGTTRGFAIQGVINYDLGQTAGQAGRLIAVDAVTFNQFNVTPVNNPGAAGATLGTTTDVTVIAATLPPNATQPNAAGTAVSANQMQGNDDRIGSAVYRVGNSILQVRNTGVSGRIGIRVTVLNATTLAVQAETLIADAQLSYYFGSIAANERGDVVVGYTRSGFVGSGNPLNRWPSAAASIGFLSGGTLTFGAPIDIQVGQAQYTLGSTRWGDYSSTQLDSTDPGIFWTTQEYSNASGSWSTRAAEIIPTVAGEVRWRAATSGTYATATNWFNNTGPAATDHAIVSRNGDGTTNYTITMPAGATANDRLSVRQGTVTFSIPSGATYTLSNAGANTPSLAIAEYQGTARMTVSGGGTLSSFTTTVGAGVNSDARTNGIAGANNVSNGALTVTGAGTTWNNGSFVYIGGNVNGSGGTGSITVDAGATATVIGSTVLYNQVAGGTANRLAVGSAGAAATYNTRGLDSNATNGTVIPIVNLANAGSLLTVNGAFDSSYGGQVTGPGALAKSNTGTFTLTGNTNNYTGVTTISGGLLNARNTSGSATGTGTVTVNSTGTLGGTGFVGGAVTVNSGGTIRGGLNNTTTIDNLTVQNDVSVNASGRFGADLANLSGATGTYTRDRLIVDGATSTLNFNTPFVIQLVNDASLTIGTPYTINIANATNGAGYTKNGGAPTFTAADFTLTGTFGTIGGATLLVSGTNLQLTFTPVPEPGTIIAVGAAALGLATAARRRWAKAKAMAA